MSLPYYSSDSIISVNGYSPVRTITPYESKSLFKFLLAQNCDNLKQKKTKSEESSLLQHDAVTRAEFFSTIPRIVVVSSPGSNCPRKIVVELFTVVGSERD